MPKNVAVQNSFIGGLKTEFTGLNFPENACTDVDNCVFTLIGDVLRREGINYEDNNVLQNINVAGKAISYYRWKNAGGDGETEIFVLQIGSNLYFFQSSASTISNPMSSTLMTNLGVTQTISLSGFRPAGSANDTSLIECQYSDGNGYLFVYHPYCDPFYVTLSAGVLNGSKITVQIRDFNGVPDGLGVNARPNVLSSEHNYNLQNQGWGTSTNYWTATTTIQPPLVNIGVAGNFATYQLTTGAWTIVATVTNPTHIIVGQTIAINGNIIPPAPYSYYQANGLFYGIVSSYPGTGNVIGITITSLGNFNYSYTSQFGPGLPQTPANIFPGYNNNFTIYPVTAFANQITTWASAFNNYPSNSDIWWLYKDSSGAYSPSTTIGDVSQPISPAPKGHFIVNAFDQEFTQISGVTGITPVTTTVRPQSGTWFQGRVFYTGVNASQSPTGDQAFYTWTENIYFSQIITSTSNPQFGLCYQTNDPTDENFFDILPTDGGVITIQGSGNIYKLFPIQNGLLVFASNGIWFITGSQGIGFSATDYTITKIDNVRSISSYSFISVRNLPVFWNEEGIYMVEPSQSGTQGFAVNAITVGTILSFYNNIPLASKIYARGDYDPINYVVQWVYRSTGESSISNRYQFDSALSLNIVNKAFYPYTVSSNSNSFISGLSYVSYPSGAVPSGTQPEPMFKYITTQGTNITFSEENDDVNWKDWFSYDSVGVDYTSFFETGFSLAGKAVAKWQPIIVEMFSRGANQYTIQGVFDYANSGNTGRYSSVQVVANPNVITYASGIAGPDLTDYAMYYRRHKIRGYGVSLQILVSSVSGQPFDIMGWGILQDINVGI